MDGETTERMGVGWGRCGVGWWRGGGRCQRWEVARVGSVERLKDGGTMGQEREEGCRGVGEGKGRAGRNRALGIIEI